MTVAANVSQPPIFLKLLSHPIRWQLLQILAQTDLRVHELVYRLNQPQNLVSYHLQLLRQQQVIREHRSSADGRSVYYSLDLERFRTLYFSSAESLHPGLGKEEKLSSNFPSKPIRVLFLCTNNSARSQMAEAILHTHSRGQIEVFSAGTEPTEVHPLAIRVMAEMNIDIRNYRSKSLEEFTGHQFDTIITVCDRAREACPVFPGDPVRIHWSIPDPAIYEGTESERYQIFKDTAVYLNNRIGYLLLMLQKGQK